MPVIPFGIGFITGFISAIGFAKVNSFLLDKINLHDTCGVHYLHGIPGIIGAIAAAIHCANLSTSFGTVNAALFLHSLGNHHRTSGQ
jgi:ammonium transporter Rh